jgi:hypothetical protein
MAGTIRRRNDELGGSSSTVYLRNILDFSLRYNLRSSGTPSPPPSLPSLSFLPHVPIHLPFPRSPSNNHHDFASTSPLTLSGQKRRHQNRHKINRPPPRLLHKTNPLPLHPIPTLPPLPLRPPHVLRHALLHGCPCRGRPSSVDDSGRRYR